MLTARNRLRRWRRAASELLAVYEAIDPLIGELAIMSSILGQAEAMAAELDEGKTPSITPSAVLANARAMLSDTRIACVLPVGGDLDRHAELVISALWRASRSFTNRLNINVARLMPASAAFDAAVREALLIRPGMTLDLLAAIERAGLDAAELGGMPLARVGAAWSADPETDLAEEARLARLLTARLAAMQASTTLIVTGGSPS